MTVNFDLTLTSEHELDTVKVNRHAKYMYPGERSFRSVIVPNTQIHTPE